MCRCVSIAVSVCALQNVDVHVDDVDEVGDDDDDETVVVVVNCDKSIHLQFLQKREHPPSVCNLLIIGWSSCSHD
mgnify:CR=1 FL=1